MKEKVERYRRILEKDPVLYPVWEKLNKGEGGGSNRSGREEGTGEAVKNGIGRAAAGTGKESCLTDTALCVMAPVMCSFVAWVLGKAWADGKKRLYFLARDGYSMYETARVFCEKTGLPIECRYLYCSRYAWRQAEYHLLKEESLSALCLGGIDVSFRKVMFRAGLKDSEVPEAARLLDWKEDCDTPLTYRQLRELQTRLKDCGPFMEGLYRRSRKSYPTVTGYLKQEGLSDPVPWALVDSGWTGSMQKSLQRLLESMGYKGRAEGYYFGMYEYPQGADRDTYHCFYFDPVRGLKRKMYFSNSLFECIFSSPEGMTVGYEKRGEGYDALLEKRWNPNQEKIMATTEYLRRYAEELSEIWGKEFIVENGCKQSKKTGKTVFSLLKEFMGKPTAQEAEEFGSYVFCDDVIGESTQQAAAELTIQQIRENRILNKVLSRLKKRGSPVRESAWLEGSMIRSGLGTGELRHCAAGKCVLYLRKELKNR